MSSLWSQILALVSTDQVKVSVHGYDELASDGIRVRDILTGVTTAEVVEEYAEYHKGPCVLVLQRDPRGAPLHVVWGIPAGQQSPAVLVTAYRPDPNRWDETWMRRKSG